MANKPENKPVAALNVKISDLPAAEKMSVLGNLNASASLGCTNLEDFQAATKYGPVLIQSYLDARNVASAKTANPVVESERSAKRRETPTLIYQSSTKASALPDPFADVRKMISGEIPADTARLLAFIGIGSPAAPGSLSGEVAIQVFDDGIEGRPTGQKGRAKNLALADLEFIQDALAGKPCKPCNIPALLLGDNPLTRDGMIQWLTGKAPVRTIDPEK